MALMRCVGINGTGPARTLMAMDLLTAQTESSYIHCLYDRLIIVSCSVKASSRALGYLSFTARVFS